MSGSTEKPFSIGGFYGVKNKRKWVGIERSVEDVVKKHRSEKIPKSYPCRILGPCTKWQTFFRQQDAFTACRSLDTDLHVFAFESESFEGNTGQRMYLVASYPVFWNYYEQMTASQRHHYEVIPQGCVSKLYFDLEFERAFNRGRDGDRMVNILIQIFCAALEKEFDVKCSRSDVLDLEASTDKKFSRHLIFQMDNVVFKNNVHAGNFVSHVLTNLLDRLHINKTPPLFDQGEADADEHAEVGSTHGASDDNLHNQTTNGENKGQDSLIASKPDLDTSKCTDKESMKSNISETNMHKEELSNKMSGKNEAGTNGKQPDTSKTTTTDCVTIEPDVYTTICNSDPVAAAKELIDTAPSGSEAGMTMATDDGAVNPEPDSTTETGGAAVKVADSTTATDGAAVKVEGSSVSEVFQDFSLEDLQQMVVKNKHGDDTLFCDLGVYTKNRNFRLYLSSKLNKNNPLRLSDRNKYTLPPSSYRNKYTLPEMSGRKKCTTSQASGQSGIDERVFYHSLVSNVVYTSSTRVLTFGNDTDKQFCLAKGQRKRGSKVNKKESIDGYNKSPYPEVDEYISSIITENGNKGVIRHWTYFHLGELLLYEISHYRFCHNIGRQHRSNNIMYIVDMRKGVFYQKCHDPDCHMQNYKSEEWSLPRHILPESFFDDDDDDDMGDEELLNSTLEMEKKLMDTAAAAAASGMSVKRQDDMDDGSDDYLLEVAGQLENSFSETSENRIQKCD